MKKNDVILVAGILLLAALGFGFSTLQKREEGARVVVYVDAEAAQEYSLEEDGEYEIETQSGNNLLIIKDGRADMTEADCPDQLCVKQKSISRNGETIVCLPHKVVVEIEGAREAEMDAISR